MPDNRPSATLQNQAIIKKYWPMTLGMSLVVPALTFGLISAVFILGSIALPGHFLGLGILVTSVLAYREPRGV
jgi:hypothetical protein